MLANRLRLVLHAAAYWLVLALRDAIPRTAPLARAEFATLRLRLIKIGARVIERTTRVRIHFTSACPDASVFRLLAGRLTADRLVRGLKRLQKVSGDADSDTLRCFPHRVAREMRIARGRLHPAVTEEPADDWQPLAERERPRGEGVAYTMYVFR